jgi:hypothetical protein
MFHPWKEQNLAGFPLSAASLLIRENGGGGLGGGGDRGAGRSPGGEKISLLAHVLS